MTALLFGGDYNPEQWPREVWDEDVALMKRASVNTVALGIFAWSTLEPEEGRYEFGWLDDAIELMHANGIGVILATPTASPPPWFSLAHPEGLPVSADGVRLMHGSRDTYDPASSAYRAAARRIATALAERYGKHPALRAWHLHNEYGTISYGPEVAQRFRVWLEAKYGTLNELNRAWYTRFWSQGYGAWAEIQPPLATEYLKNPSQVLDFKRFAADLLLDCYQEQIEVVKQLSPGVPVTTNFMLPTWLNYDPWDFAAVSDLVTVDHYIEHRGVEGAAQAAFGADLARSFNGGKPWLLMEQAMNLTMCGGKLLAKEPGAGLRTSLQHVSRGSEGALFFQWRTAPSGAEMFHSTLVPHAGPDTRVFREVCELGALLRSLGGVALPLGSPTAAGEPVVSPRVAIAWSADAWWATQSPGLPSRDHVFHADVRRMHRALWMLGYHTDFVRLDSSRLAEYALVLVPSYLVASDAEVAGLTAFVSGGGHTAVWHFSGTFDDEMHIELGGYAGRFAPMLGVQVEELQPLEDGETVTLAGDLLAAGACGSAWSELVNLRGAAVEASYAEGPAAGHPAISVNRYGDGLARYVSTTLDDDALDALLLRALADAGVEKSAPEAGAGLEVVRRLGADGEYVFVINHTSGERTIELSGADAATGAPLAGTLALAAGEYRVVRPA